jgi:hypothetical protein
MRQAVTFLMLMFSAFQLDGETRSHGPQDVLKHLSWRSIGPAEMGGRTIDIAAVPGDPSIVYMATASGGLWKTTNAGGDMDIDLREWQYALLGCGRRCSFGPQCHLPGHRRAQSS